jgi:signal transduction histidine kinase
MAKGRHGRSVAVTLFVVMMAVAVVPLAIMAIQGYHCASMAVVELQKANLESVLQSREARLRDWLHERQADLTALAGYPCTLEQCTHRQGAATNIRGVCELLDHAHARTRAYESLVAYSPTWQRVNQSSRSVHTDEELLLPRFMESLTKSGEPVVTLPHFHDGGMFGIHMGCPILGGTSNKLGYLVAALDLSATVHPILRDRTGFGKTTRTYIVSADGRYFSQPAEGVHLLREKASLPAGLLAGEGRMPYTYDNCMGTKVIGVSSRIPSLDWVLVAEIERAEAFAWLGSLRRRAILTGCLTLLLVGFLALRSAHWATVPLKRLATVARDVSAGHFEKRLGELKGREPQEVARAFNGMLDKLAAAQRDLVQAASLAAVGELSSSIVHEMRNPLSSVKMNVKALRQKVADDEIHAELADIAAQQAERLEQMLNDLLQYGKPVELHEEVVRVSEVLADSSTALAPLSRTSDVTLSIEDRTGGRTTAMDREQMRRAITNLGDNALRASPRGGATTIAAEILASEQGEELVIAVEDSGEGLSEAVRERLFEPFFTARGDGTGLGLANVRKIVELHGGTVVGDNRAEGGARFTIRLPLGGMA